MRRSAGKFADLYHNLGGLGLSDPHVHAGKEDMGAENFLDVADTGKRGAKRARVLLAVKIQTEYGEIDGRLRDVSRKGALVECSIACPDVGSEVLFSRGTTTVPARVAWSGGMRIGLEFAYAIDETEMLVHLGKAGSAERSPAPVDYGQSRFRRPRLFEADLDPQQRKLARAWGASVGIKLPGA